MALITNAKADLAELADRPRIVAEVLKRVPADHALSYENREALRKEVKVIAAQLLGAYELSRFTDATSSGKLDPKIWRQRAEEVRAIVEATSNVGVKDPLLEIAEFYDGVIATQEIPN